MRGGLGRVTHDLPYSEHMIRSMVPLRDFWIIQL